MSEALRLIRSPKRRAKRGGIVRPLVTSAHEVDLAILAPPALETTEDLLGALERWLPERLGLVSLLAGRATVESMAAPEIADDCARVCRAIARALRTGERPNLRSESDQGAADELLDGLLGLLARVPSEGCGEDLTPELAILGREVVAARARAEVRADAS